MRNKDSCVFSKAALESELSSDASCCDSSPLLATSLKHAAHSTPVSKEIVRAAFIDFVNGQPHLVCSLDCG